MSAPATDRERELLQRLQVQSFSLSVVIADYLENETLENRQNVSRLFGSVETLIALFDKEKEKPPVSR